MSALICGIISLVFGILGFSVAPIWGAIVGIVLGIIAINLAKKSEGESGAKAGKVLGIIGLILGIISLVVGIIIVVAAVALVGAFGSALGL